jgi:membrane protease YdiL (CAAX protease family)
VIVRALEILLLFVGVPAAMRWGPLPRNPLPILIGAGGLCAWLLLRDPNFDPSLLWNAAGLRAYLGQALLAMLVSVPLLWALMRWLVPDEAFALVRRQPGLWVLILIAYPIVSVYPQELLYRAWLHHRLTPLVPGMAGRIVLSALAFAWGHVFFPAPRVAMLLTLAGGVLFAWHYEVSRSLLVPSLEHALFGDLLFTIGLGRYFYHRGEPALARSTRYR